MPIYVIFNKELELGKMLPRFQVVSEKPTHNHRVYELTPGDCIDAAEIHFGDNTLTWIKIDCYRVSNIDNEPRIEFLESYNMRYLR